MFPEADRALGVAAVYGFALAGVVVTLAAFKAADVAVGLGSRALARIKFFLAPACVDCWGKGYRRWKDGDGAPLRGWTDCRLCRGVGRIVDEE
jgi:hypothetical protein